MKTTITFSRTETHSQFKMAIAKCFLVLLLLFGVNSAFSQVSGDYRSNGVGSAWATAANWEKYNGTAWEKALFTPNNNSNTKKHLAIAILNCEWFSVLEKVIVVFIILFF